MSFIGATSGPSYALFIMGGLTKSANWVASTAKQCFASKDWLPFPSQGALVGCAVGTVLNLVVVFGSRSVPQFSPFSPPLPTDACPLANTTQAVNGTLGLQSTPDL